MAKGVRDDVAVLRRAIQECGLSHGELARRTGVSQPQLSRFVRGERSLRIDAAAKVWSYLGLGLVPVRRGRGAK